MIDLKVKVVLAYKVPRITTFVDEDIKQMKRLNQVLQRLEKYEKDQYILESTNILKILNNVFDLNLLYPVLCEIVDIRFHTTISFLIDKINNTNPLDIKKLKELSDDED